MHSIINDMRDFNGILGNHFTLKLANFNVFELIHEVKSLFSY